MANTVLRIDLLFGWKFHIQISTALRYGSSTTFDRSSLADHLQLRPDWIDCLRGRYGWPVSIANGVLPLDPHPPITRWYHLVQYLLPAHLRPSDEVYRPS